MRHLKRGRRHQATLPRITPEGLPVEVRVGVLEARPIVVLLRQMQGNQRVSDVDCQQTLVSCHGNQVVVVERATYDNVSNTAPGKLGVVSVHEEIIPGKRRKQSTSPFQSKTWES